MSKPTSQALKNVATGNQRKPSPQKGVTATQEDKFKGVLITPNDPVFFRDGKPFTMGEEVHTTGIFPPLPSVIQGALRSVYFKKHPDTLPAQNGTKPDPTAKAEFRNLLLCHNKTELLFPLPADLLPTKTDGLKPLQLKVRDEALYFSSLTQPYPCFLESNYPGKVESSAFYYLTSQGMNTYLKGEKVPMSAVLNLKKGNPLEKEKLLEEETRVGIGRTPYEVTAEGQLYRMSRLRLHENLQFYVACKGLPLEPRGQLSLGSEGVSAYYSANRPLIQLPQNTLVFSPDTIYKLYVQSPLVVEAGLPYIPRCLTQAGVKLLTYSTERPAAVGGWDMKTNGPKPLRYAIPTGAVYYFNITNKNTFTTINALHGVPQGDPAYCQQGFGTVLLGIYKDS